MNFNQDGNKVKDMNAALNRVVFNTLSLNFLIQKFDTKIKYNQIIFAHNFKQYINIYRN